MYKKILLSVDDSDFAKKAAQHTLALAKKEGASVDIINVVVPVTGFAHYERLFTLAPSISEVYDDVGKRVLEDSKAIFASYPAVKTQLLHGDPATEIIEHSKGGYDLLVMGSHGSGGPGIFSMGSVVSKVIHHAKISVLVVK